MTYIGSEPRLDPPSPPRNWDATFKDKDGLEWHVEFTGDECVGISLWQPVVKDIGGRLSVGHRRVTMGHMLIDIEAKHIENGARRNAQELAEALLADLAEVE
jgi:hypothetical protein